MMGFAAVIQIPAFFQFIFSPKGSRFLIGARFNGNL